MIHQFDLRVKKYLSFLFLATFSVLFLLSCKGAKSAQKDSDVLPQALLWKIEGQDLKEPSYLFGTIHMIPKKDYFLPTGLEDAFEASERVIFEIDLDEMSDMTSMMDMLTNLIMKDGMTLKKLLTPEEYKEVSEYFENMGLPMFLVGKVKPMFLAMLAEVNMDPSAMQSEEIASYEMELFDKANNEGKEVGGLETMAYQMSLFDSIPYEEQAKMLVETIRGTSMESDLFDQTVELYKRQDIEAMVNMVIDADSTDGSDYENILLHNRNHNWIPLMAKKMASGSVFFAVGAGHLGGEEGVIRLLKKAGYQLTPVSEYKAGSPKRI